MSRKNSTYGIELISNNIYLYINKYYEKNLTTGNITSYYYLGGRLVAMKQGNDLRYIHQDHLTGTSLTTDSSGAAVGTIKYLPFGTTLSTTGTLDTDKRFTGQRLDSTGLYYYGARYYSPHLGRFISPDTVIPNPANPQSFNRYSYCLNNPLKYTDPSGYYVYIGGYDVGSLYNDMSNFFYGMPSQWEIEAIVSPEFQAYNEFRPIDSILTKTLETSERIITIGFGETRLDSTFSKNGDDRTITINSDYSRADSWWIAGQIYTQSTNFVDMFAPLINQDTIYDVVSLIPAGRAAGLWGEVAGEGGKYYEAAKAIFDVSDAVIDYRQPYGDSGWDLTVSIITTAGGFSPWWLVAGLFQLGWDINKAGTQFYNDIQARGGVYQFKP